MQALTVDPKNIFYRRNAIYNYIEVVDAESGTVLAVQNDYNENVLLGKMDDLLEVTIGDKTLLMQRGMTLSEYKPISHKYSRPLADLIVQAIVEGLGVTKACEKFGVGYSTFMRWCEKVPELGQEIDKAKTYRAEKSHDKIMEIADTLETKQLNKTQVDALKAAGDLHKWSAEKSSPQKFGNSKDKPNQGALQIIINTGISREEPTTVEVIDESKRESPRTEREIRIVSAEDNGEVN
jgi:transposase